MKGNERRYYAVQCKCGHVGRDCYIPIEFAVIASSKKEAAEIGRNIPRCKHHHKDCILNVRELSYQDYIKLNKENANDPYLHCKSIQEQSVYDLSDRLIADPHYYSKSYSEEKESQRHTIFQGKERIRNPKKFVKLYELKEAYCY